MKTSRPTCALVLAAILAALHPLAAGGQSVVARTPNLDGVWTAPPGVVQFNFIHRFSIGDPPARKVTNTPTFDVGTGLWDRAMVGFVYGSSSTLVPSYPNEWELYAKARPLTQGEGSPLSLSVQGGYNVASESVDGEIAFAREVGPVRLLAVGRGFHAAFDERDARFAVAGGASVSLTPNIAVAGDVGTLLDRASGEPWVWSAGLQMGVPYTPHSFSIHASNVGTASLEGVSRGDRTRWGFEYTVPITLRRYTAPRAETTEPAQAAPMAPQFRDAQASGDTVYIDIRNLAFAEPEPRIEPGTTIVWTNRDPFPHTVTSDEGLFDSGLINAEESYALTFPEAGTFPIHCTPHPWITGRVIVGGGDQNAPAGGDR